MVAELREEHQLAVDALEAGHRAELECLKNNTDALWSGTAKNQDVSTGPLARPFARTAHSFACSGLLASLAPSAALTRSLARSLRSLPRSWESV